MARRPKKRYVVVKAEPDMPREKIFEAVREAYRELFGALGLAEAELRAYKSRDFTIIRCDLNALPKLLLATAAVTHIDEKPVALRVLLVSGTLRRAREAA